VFRAKEVSRLLIEGPFVVIYKPIDIIGRYYTSLWKVNKWLFLSDFTFNLELLADLGILKNVEIFLDIQSNS